MTSFTFVAAAVGILWLALYVAEPHTRFEQLVMSAFGLLVAPAALLLTAPSGRTLVPASYASHSADLLFVVAIFGVSASLYHLLVEPHAVRLNRPRTPSRRHRAHWIAHLMVAGGVWMTVALASRLVFALPPAQAFALGGLLVGIYTIADRKDLLLKALLSGTFTTVLVVSVELLFAVRLFDTTILPFAGLPVEEILWAAVVGFTIGPLYEYARHLRAI